MELPNHKMNRTDYARALASLPAKLTIAEVSHRLGLSYQVARSAIRKHGYDFEDGRAYGQKCRRKFNPERADWTRSNIAIAWENGISRERVRVIRGKLGKPFVESRGQPRKYAQRRDC